MLFVLFNTQTQKKWHLEKDLLDIFATDKERQKNL